MCRCGLPCVAATVVIMNIANILPALLIFEFVESGAVNEGLWLAFAIISLILNVVSITLIAILLLIPSVILNLINLIWQLVMALNVINNCFGIMLVREAIASVSCSDASSENRDGCIEDGRYVGWVLAVIILLIGLCIQAAIAKMFLKFLFRSIMEKKRMMLLEAGSIKECADMEAVGEIKAGEGNAV